ncbi:MAG: tetratricopeptide repeat protein [Desulfovibrionaceae bacterium]|nr:tetratricopeptide repeat protein [Desulfovibrionaceae bacterium]
MTPPARRGGKIPPIARLPMMHSPFFPPFGSWPRAALLACGLWLALPALADEYAEVQRLQKSGQTAEALARAEEYIAANPDDPQMRFIKANLLAASRRAGEAEQLLLQMTRETPELPEPWNNLAVLHAAQGQLDMALSELQSALRLNPGYATALENLGDVQARLALQAWQRARQLDGGNQRLPPKIEALHGALGAASKPAN